MLTYLFGDESGDFKTKPYFIIGCLRTQNPQFFEQKISELRKKLNFSFEVKYSNTNKLKIPLCKAMIDLFFKSRNIEFRCITKSNLIFDLSYYKNNRLGIPAKDLAYNKTYCDLIKHNINIGERVLVYIDKKSRVKKDNLLEYLRREIPQIVDVQPRNSRDLNLLQLADLITGSIYGNLTGNNHPVKKELQNYILNYLPISNFKERINVSKFNVWHWRPPKQNPPHT